MSCDRNRSRYFQRLPYQHERLAELFGGTATATSALELIYDVAANQPPSSDPAEAGRVQAAMQLLFAEAARDGVKLYEHGASPKPEAAYAWSVVATTLKAVRENTALPPLAEDVRCAEAFRANCEQYQRGWTGRVAPEVRRTLRACLATQLSLVAAIVADQGEAGKPEYAPLLAEMTNWLFLDAKIAPDVLAAAKQYQTLAAAEALGPEERAAWARVLAAHAGVGVARSGSPPRYANSPVCPHCGRKEREHLFKGRCLPGDGQAVAEVAMAVTAVYASPAHNELTLSGSPYQMMERLLDGPMRQGPPYPDEDVRRLVAVAVESDRRLAQFIANWPSGVLFTARDDSMVSVRLRDATLRTPLILDGQEYVWEFGKLYPAAEYRSRFHWGWRGDPTTDQMRCGLRAADTLSREHLARLMVGAALPPEVPAYRWG